MIRSLRRWSIVFLIPGLALYLYIVIGPMVQAVNTGFYEWKPGLQAVFIGLDNYADLFTDQVFLRSVGNTFTLMLGAMAIQLPLGFVFALLIHRKVRGHAFFQTVFFIPMVLSTVVIAVLWAQIYQPRFGLLNTALEWLGLSALQRSWLGDTETALWSIIAVVGWQFVGLYMLIFLAALQRIPASITEAAALDGAVGWRRTRTITLPLIFDSFKLSVILAVTGSVQYFNLIWAMTQGGPANSSSVLASFMYIEAFRNSNLGLAAAVATVMLALNFVLAVGLQKVLHREPYELG